VGALRRLARVARLEWAESATLEPPGVTGLSESVDRVGQIETHGVDLIPESERHSRPANIFWILIGGQMTVSVMVLGWIPIAFGLGWWSAASSLVVGAAIGSLLASPIAMLGLYTGTNSPVSSGAFFGVVGRLVGSALGLFISLGFFALAVWVGGQAAVEGAHKLFGTPDSHLALAISYVLITVVSTLAAVMGHANMVAVQKLMIPTAGLVFLISAIVLAPKFHAGYHGGHYVLGSFWSTWALSVTTAVAGPLGYSVSVNDWSRYISPRRWKPRNAAFAFGLGLFVAVGGADLFGAYIASMFKDPGTDFITGWVQIAPAGIVALLLAVGVFGTFGQGSMMLYSIGLDVSSLVPFLRRVIATALLSALALVFVLVGTLVFDAEQTVASFVTLFVVVLMPWVIICAIGHFWRRAHYSIDDLQVFNRNEDGGLYWFWHGWSPRGTLIWLVCSVLGLLCSNTSVYSGPWSNIANGVDMSLVVSGTLAAVLYFGSLVLVPENPALRAAATSGGGRAAPLAAELVPEPAE